MATSKLVHQALGGAEIDEICDELDRDVPDHNQSSASIGLFSLIVPDHLQQIQSPGSTPRPNILLDSNQQLTAQSPAKSRVGINQGLPDLAAWDCFDGSVFEDPNQLPVVYELVDQHIFDPQLVPDPVAICASESVLLVNNEEPPSRDGFGLLVASPSSFTNALPETTYFLLDHYKTNMLASFSPKHNSYPPWKVLHLPSALQAVSEIGIWGSADHARTSLLYSILTLCAFNLDTSSNPNLHGITFWREKATAYCHIAQEQLTLSATSSADKQRPGGIDEFVIATMSMNTISVSLSYQSSISTTRRSLSTGYEWSGESG